MNICFKKKICREKHFSTISQQRKCQSAVTNLIVPFLMKYGNFPSLPFYSTKKKGSHKRCDTNTFEPIITNIFPREPTRNLFLGRFSRDLYLI